MSFSARVPCPASNSLSRTAFSLASPPVTTLSGARSTPPSSGVSSISVITPSDRRIARVSPWSATSSSPDPWTTSASRTPTASSVCAIRRSIFGSATPSNCTGGRAGLMHGPSKFITVRTDNWRRTSAACFIPG